MSSKIYSCPFEKCNATYRKRWRFQEHVLTHTVERPFLCKEESCQKAYKSSSHLKRHVRVFHLKENPPRNLKCPFENCIMTFADSTGLNRHKRTHETTLYRCVYCKDTYRKKSRLAAHLAEHEGFKFECEICQTKFDSMKLKKKHVRQHRLHNCEECDMTFYKWSEYRKHVKNSHPSVFDCETCGKQYNRKGPLEQHILHHLSFPSSRELSCPFKDCDKTYSYNRNLRQHIRSYHEKKKFACDIAGCTKSYVIYSHLSRHKQSHYEPVEVKKPKPKTIRDGRRRRWDHGLPKSSTAVHLSGFRLPAVVQRQISCGITETDDGPLIGAGLEVDNCSKLSGEFVSSENCVSFLKEIKTA